MVITTRLTNASLKLAPLSEFTDNYDGLLCDIWGVLHNGIAAFDDAVDALCRYRADGGVVILITNAPRSNREIYQQLERFGVPREAFDSVVTSGDIASILMAEKPAAPLFHFGPARDHSILDGLTNTIVGIKDAELCLLTGPLDDTIETVEIYQSFLIEMRNNAVEMICANPDLVVHSGGRTVICAGSIAQQYAKLGGTVVFAGKPEALIYEEALKKMARIAGRNIPTRRLLALGDGLLTDIKGAAINGLDAYFITGGIHAKELGDMNIQTNVTKAVNKIESLFVDINLVGISDQLRWV